jgi:hypothetical protein
VPLLAQEGIDVDDIDVLDLDTLQPAMNRPVEGAQRPDSLLLVGTRTGDHHHTAGDQAIAGGNATLAAAIVDQAASHQTTSLYRRRLHRLCPGLLDDG